VRNKGLQPKKK